jgi:hypothetical protein
MIKSFIGIGLASFLACGAWAQQQDQPAPPSDASNSAGLLGKNYVDFGLFTEHFRNTDSKNGYGTDLDLNLPAFDNFDIGLNYAFERATGVSQITDNTLGTSFTGYFATGKVKPFADLDFGYAWQRTKVDGIATRYDRGIYGAGAGLEVPVTGSTVVQGRAAYDNSFRKGAVHERVYTATVAQNITDDIAAKVNVSFREKNSTVYDLGLVFFF